MPREVKALKWLVVDLLAAHVDELIELAGEALRALPPDARHALLAVARRKGCLDDAALDALVDETATALDVSGCGDAVTDTGVRALAARGALRSVVAADITSCRGITADGIRELVSGAPNLEVLRCGGDPACDAACRDAIAPARPGGGVLPRLLDSRRRSLDSWEALGEDDDVLEIGGPDSGVSAFGERRARASLARLARRRPRQPRPGGAAVSPRARDRAVARGGGRRERGGARRALRGGRRRGLDRLGRKERRARRGGGREPTKTARARSTRHYGRFERQRRSRVGRRIRHRECPRPWDRFSSGVSNVREPTLVVPAARRRLGRPSFSGGPDARAEPSRRPARATGRVRRHTRGTGGDPKPSRRPGALASGLRRASRPARCAGA